MTRVDSAYLAMVVTTKQLHLVICYANQFHALNETGMSSNIWNYNDKNAFYVATKQRNNEIMQ